MEALPEVGKVVGDRFALSHLSYEAQHSDAQGVDSWSLALSLLPSAQTLTGLTSIALRADGTWEMATEIGSVTGAYSCSVSVLLTTPENYLLGILEEYARAPQD